MELLDELLYALVTGISDVIAFLQTLLEAISLF